MRLDDPILLPFEASGVETIWTLEMPKGANRFDYGAIADVLFTIRYTALEDVTYRTKVLQQMGVDANGILRQASTISFNITQAFPDEWYDLHNPEFVPDVGDYGFGPGKVKPPYQLQIKLRAIDFAPNEDRQRLTRVSLALRQESFARLPLEIEFQPEDSVTRYAYDSDYTWDPQDQTTAPWSFVAFTHQRNAEDAPWQAAVTPLNGLAPFGTWWIKIKNGGKRLDGQAIASATYPEVFGQLPSRYNQEVLDLTGLQDILLALAYEADTTYRYSS
jgi:hypothetical protein